MKFRISCASIVTLCIITYFVAAVPMVAAALSENHQHGAHEHGVAHLNVAIEGNNLYIEFISPAANIVGFEHHPRTADQKSAVREAVQAFKAADKLFALTSGAGAKLVKSVVHTDIEDDHKHKSGEAHSSGPNETSRKDKREEDSSHQGGHHDEDEREQHSEFKAEYHFVCSKPNNLTQIDVLLFHVFPGVEHIEVQLLTGARQTAMELTAGNSQINI